MDNDYKYKSTGVISQIFQDYLNNYYLNYKNIIDMKRQNDNKEVHKIINCYNHNLDSFVYLYKTFNEIIFCGKCNTRINPITIEVDY